MKKLEKRRGIEEEVVSKKEKEKYEVKGEG